jgi:hypothetical protein
MGIYRSWLTITLVCILFSQYFPTYAWHIAWLIYNAKNQAKKCSNNFREKSEEAIQLTGFNKAI